jgi:Domain of Unknown Function with PDB structure (DUF3857)/Domain of Unknown Function with PDB structure (DUF3858)
MKRRAWLVIAVCCACVGSAAAAAESQQNGSSDRVSAERLEREFFSNFNLSAAAADADKLLRLQPGDFTALFIRMEAAALQQRTEVVLDSALRLCTMPAPPDMQEIASSRILENAANSQTFDDVLRRVGLAMEESNACTFNLRLALVAAAADGTTRLDLDKTAESAGLLTRWRIAGPFGRFSNVDFERQWAPETAPFWSGENLHVESFWFRDGMAALPEYLSGPGVFYAASDVHTGSEQTSRLDILSPGPYTVYVDGQQVLAKDYRYTMGGNRESLQLHLKAGRHRVVVKFTADAAPFSVDLHPEFVRNSRAASLAVESPLEEYVHALLEYFRGNLSAVERILASGDDEHEHGPFLYLRALLWSAAEERSPRARAAWEALSKVQVSALLARIRAAELAVENRPPNELRAEIADLERQRPESEAVAQLALHLARGNSSATAQALSRLLAVHPSCARLTEALKVYTSAGDQAGAQRLERRLSHCAPESLDYPRVLSQAGRHSEAATLLRQMLAHNHLNRAARRMLVQELALSGEMEKAREQAHLLQQIAPGKPGFARLAADPGAVLNSHSPRGDRFFSDEEFYTAYRRNGLEAVRSTAQQSFPGSAIAFLLSDRVLKIYSDGSAALYSHHVTRLLNKEAINRYGEVALPRGADLLELRTIKRSGQVIEPELVQQKPTISMPALEPGDSIEEEFVADYPDWRSLPRAASLFEFGSFLAPVVRSRFVLLTPKSADINVELCNGAPLPVVEANANEVIRTWEFKNTPPIAAEPFAPAGNLLPAISVAPVENSLDRLRDALIEATRVGPHVIEAVLGQKFPQAISDREKARRLYRFVTSRIESTGPDLAASTAEDTLSADEGSRTAALLALARVAGLKAGLLMAHKVDHLCAANPLPDCYTEPLVRFWAGGEVIDADAEADDLAFGAISAGLDQHGALLIAPSAKKGESSPEMVALSIRPAQERSVAEGDLFLDTNGNLAASIHVRLGATRAQQVRAGLRRGGDAERQSYFEQLAVRIFPGATAVRGAALHLNDPEQPLELTIDCKVPQFIAPHAGFEDISQLVPALGLRSFFSNTSVRRFPLLLDSVFSESTVFHLHLPPGVAVRTLPHDFVSRSEFGEYAVRFSQADKQLDVKREFEIPVQVVEPAQFPAFLEFARQIERAEQQPITLRTGGTAAEMRSSVAQSENR